MRVVIIGGGPGGYEAALVGAQLGGEVTLIEDRGLGGSAVLTDVVPSKSLIAVSGVMSRARKSNEMGLVYEAADSRGKPLVKVDLMKVNASVKALAKAQSDDIRHRLERDGITLIEGRGRLNGPHEVIAETATGEVRLPADYILVSVGTRPRTLPDAQPDGERILTWAQLYDIDEIPERLIVVGSGVTGTEFANAYDALGVPITLVSSQPQVLPGQDPDATKVLQALFHERGMDLVLGSRAVRAHREGNGVVVTLEDGREVLGSHVLMAVGSIPNTHDIGLTEAGVILKPSGHINVDRVSRSSAQGVYAAGDCTGVFPLASVAAMQGRIAMWHALGDAVEPFNRAEVSSNIFTNPEIATVGVTQDDIDSGRVRGIGVTLPLASNPRAKMLGFKDGFVKLFCRPSTGNIIGGVIVAPRASELIHSIAIAVAEQINVDDFAHDFTVYPSLSGSIAEAARRLHGHSIELLNQQITL
ncbi:NAD(P)H-quinone dehydrogenase [Granulicoccus phenolivorans]|uniref:NAD(P)H-quinone dehydrogenase n=1 Tax=Granulicoccus phenolivorans TaxID=266854 RepID=UPI00040558A1|nr:NAD(P)H-quinone dehydrogenase [Granulicoccus phenolivorans]